MSVTIIALNEEKNIARAIESVRGFAQEILVIDSGSTDQTVEVARHLGPLLSDGRFDTRFVLADVRVARPVNPRTVQFGPPHPILRSVDSLNPHSPEN